MTWNELKIKCENSDRFNSLTDAEMKVYRKEIIVAKRFYDNNRNLYEELIEKQSELQNDFAIPYLLELTDSMTTDKKNYVQVKNGSSGGIDIDTDWQGTGREKIYEYLVKKYNKDQVIHVGTFSLLGPKSAAKDLLRVYDIDFGESNSFTKVLESELSWEDNLKSIKANNPIEWNFYNKHKEILDLVPDFIGKVRQCLPWDQDVDIVDKNGIKTKKPIGLINNTEDHISYMSEDGKTCHTKNYDVFPAGKKRVFEITTSKGKKIRASANHKFFLENGEVKKLKDLKKDDKIVVGY